MDFNFKLTPAQKRQIGWAGGGFLAFLIWWNLLFVPQWKAWNKLCFEAGVLKKEVMQTRQKKDQLPKMEAEREQLSLQHPLPAAGITPGEQLPKLFEAVTQVARGSQVKLVSAKPTAEVSQLTPGVSGFLEVPVQIELIGGYHAIGAFLDALEHSDNLIRVQNIKIQPDPKDMWHHKVTLIVLTYLFPETEVSKSK